MTDPLNELRKLAEARANATAGPWFYLYPHDPSYDWGYIRGGEQPLGWTQLPCILRASTSQMSDEELNQHRYNNTDPTADLCTFIALAGSLDLQAILSAWERDRELLRQASAYVKNDLDEITERLGQHSCGPDNGCDMDCVSRHHVGTLYMQIQSTLTKGQQ